MTPRDYIELGGALVVILYLRRDVNGLGSKMRKVVAELIIQNQNMEKQEFTAFVRKLLG